MSMPDRPRFASSWADGVDPRIHIGAVVYCRPMVAATGELESRQRPALVSDVRTLGFPVLWYYGMALPEDGRPVYGLQIQMHSLADDYIRPTGRNLWDAPSSQLTRWLNVARRTSDLSYLAGQIDLLQTQLRLVESEVAAWAKFGKEALRWDG